MTTSTTIAATNATNATNATRTATVNIAELLREHAAAHPDQPAIVDTFRGNERITTFGQLERTVQQASALLWETGLRAGDTVLVLQPMSAELYSVLIALFRSGLVAMLVDPAAGREHVALLRAGPATGVHRQQQG